MPRDDQHMVGTEPERAGKKSGAWIWQLAVVIFVLALIWFGLGVALISLLVGVFKWPVSSVAAPALGVGVMGLTGSALHQMARRKRLPGKSPEQVAGEEFLSGGRRED